MDDFEREKDETEKWADNYVFKIMIGTYLGIILGAALLHFIHGGYLG